MAIHDPTPQQLWAHITQQPMRPAPEVETWRPHNEGHSMTPADIERMAREAGLIQPTYQNPNPYAGMSQTPMAERLARFAALVRAQSEAEAHAAIDASPAKIVRNSAEGYPGARTPQDLTLVDRIKELSQYAADWKRWCMEAEAKASGARAQALEDAARIPDSGAAALLAQKRAPQVDRHCAYVLEANAAAIRALIPKD